MHTGWRWRYSVGARPLPLKVAPIQRSVTIDFYLQSRRDSDCQMSELTTRVWELASVQMNRKPHKLESKKITEARNPKRSSKFVRGYGVLHYMLRNLMSIARPPPSAPSHREITPTGLSVPRFHAPLHIFSPPPGPAGGPSRATWGGGGGGGGGGGARWRHLM